MRSCTFENEERGLNSVDEESVWLDMTFTMVVPLAGERMVPVLERQWFLGLKMVNDGFEFVDIVAALFSKSEVFEKTAGGFDEKQDLGARAASECAKVLE
ncbi:MAG: hypothetical protein NTAFB01_30050 [Nitrospira sp.]